MTNRNIYHRDFQLKPWWWEAYNPNAMELADVPRNADVAVIGAGYAGLACALELARHGRSCVVFDAEQPGFGGSMSPSRWMNCPIWAKWMACTLR